MKQKDTDMIDLLRRATEKRFGHGVNTPSEFKRLEYEIERMTARSVSASTLMRMWGYITSDVKPNSTTLDVLAEYVGYQDFASFCQGGENDGSKVVTSEHLNIDIDLKPRDHVLLQWQPGRECLVRYLGKGQFVVERSERTKITPGDTFTCHLMVQGHPLYLDNLVHKSMPPRCYVCGQHRGVHYEVLKAD